MEMERPRRENGQQQMDTQAHHVGPQRRQKKRGTPEKAEETWGDNGRDGLTSSKDLWATNGPEVQKTEFCGKNSKKLDS